MAAWDQGCKGCTTYRPNDVTGSVLSVSEEKARPKELETSAQRLKWAQEEAGFRTQQLAADAIGVKRSRYSLWASGHQELSRQGAELVSKAFNVSASWLLFGDEEPQSELVSDSNAGSVIYLSEPLDRPQELEGQTYKLKWPDSEHAIYITINDLVIAGHRRPFEVFINSKNMEHFAWTVALTRMISAVFRRGGDVSFVVEELKAVFDPRGGAWMNGKYVPSILAAIGGVIERHMIAIGFLEGEGMGLKSDPKSASPTAARGKACPSCGLYELRMIEGCMTCASCGHSKCG